MGQMTYKYATPCRQLNWPSLVVGVPYDNPNVNDLMTDANTPTNTVNQSIANPGRFHQM